MVLLERPDLPANKPPAGTQPRRSNRLRKAPPRSTSAQSFHPDPPASEDDEGPMPPDQDETSTQSDDSSSESGSSVSESESDETDEEPGKEADTASNRDDVNTEMRQQFEDFALNHKDRHLPLTRQEKTQIRLLNILVRKRAPLNAYKELLEWHLKENHELEEHETLKHASHYTDRPVIIKKLLKRYNLEGMVPVP